MRLVILALVGAVFASGCGGASQDETDLESGMLPSEAHFIAQDVLVDCMKREGFDFEPLPFLQGIAPRSFHDFISLSNSDEYGYGATFSLLLSSLLPSGAPDRELSMEATRAYGVALFGAELDHVHDESIEGEHSHGDEAHSHLESGGCEGEAEAAVRDAGGVSSELAPTPTEVMGDIGQRLAATNEFASFESEWRVCMSSQGYDVSTVEEQFSRAFEVFGPAAEERINTLPKADPIPTVDLAWVEDRIAEDEQLAEIFRAELAMAQTDAGCRSASVHLVEDVITQLEAEFGVS